MEATVAATPTGLCIRGRVDFLNADQLCAEGSRLLNGRAEPVSVDLEQLDDAGSVVIAILMVWAKASPQSINLVSLPKSMRRVLEFTGMDELFVLPQLSNTDGSGAATSSLPSSAAAVVVSVPGGGSNDIGPRSMDEVGKETDV